MLKSISILLAVWTIPAFAGWEVSRGSERREVETILEVRHATDSIHILCVGPNGEKEWFKGVLRLVADPQQESVKRTLDQREAELKKAKREIAKLRAVPESELESAKRALDQREAELKTAKGENAKLRAELETLKKVNRVMKVSNRAEPDQKKWDPQKIRNNLTHPEKLGGGIEGFADGIRGTGWITRTLADGRTSIITSMDESATERPLYEIVVDKGEVETISMFFGVSNEGGIVGASLLFASMKALARSAGVSNEKTDDILTRLMEGVKGATGDEKIVEKGLSFQLINLGGLFSFSISQVEK